MIEVGRRQVAVIMAAVYVAGVLSALDQTIVGTALPKMVAQLHGYELYSWVFAAYYLGATATVTLVGRLSDLFGRKRIVLLSAGLFAGGSLLCGMAWTMPALVVFRGLQGVGAGGVSTGALAIVSDLFPPRERAKWQTVNSLAFTTAAAIGPAAGGILSDTLSWRWIFLLNLPLALAAMAAIGFALPPLEVRDRPSIDWLGGGLTVLGVLSIMLALTWGGRELAWSSPQIIGLVVMAAACVAAFVVVERHATEPIVPPGLLKGPVVPYCCLGMFTMGLVWFGLILVCPLFLENVLGLTATRAGGDLTPSVMLSGVASGTAGWAISRSGRIKPVAIFGSAATIAGAVWLLPLSPASSELQTVAAMIVVGLGVGWVIPPFILALQNAVRADQQGVVMGVMSLFRQMGATLGTSILGVFVSGPVATASPAVLTGAIHQGLLTLVAGALLMLGMTLIMREMPLRSRADIALELQPAG